MLSGPRSIDDERLVSASMKALEQSTSSPTPLPDPSFLWWKAQFLRRLDAEREAAAPIDMGERVHIGVAVVGAALLAIGGWDQLSSVVLAPSGVQAAELIVLLGAVALLSVVAVAALFVVGDS